MVTRVTVVRTYFRSVYDGGKVWKQSRNPLEVIALSIGANAPDTPIEAFQMQSVVETVGDWQEYEPDLELYYNLINKPNP